ncbi:hypothetical protein ACHAWU_009850 [Discostella pseudostelligera]|uniref:Uncharacterized protein n=1 Tax=Discostella pseudostelligera TaxID=259834 RepID=A0ABD3M300_9STRA
MYAYGVISQGIPPSNSKVTVVCACQAAMNACQERLTMKHCKNKGRCRSSNSKVQQSRRQISNLLTLATLCEINVSVVPLSIIVPL